MKHVDFGCVLQADSMLARWPAAKHLLRVRKEPQRPHLDTSSDTGKGPWYHVESAVVSRMAVEWLKEQLVFSLSRVVHGRNPRLEALDLWK